MGDSRRLAISIASAVLLLGSLVYLAVSGLERPGSRTEDLQRHRSDGVAATDEEDHRVASEAEEPRDAQNAARDEAGPDAENAAEARDTRPVSIEGTVRERGGEGVPGARVVAFDKTAWGDAIDEGRETLRDDPFKTALAFQESLGRLATQLTSTRTAEDGAYKLRGLREGDYRVLVSHDQFLPHRQGPLILVEDGKTARYDVELVAGHEITGKICDGEGNPVEGALVRATPADIARVRGLGKVIQTLLDQGEGKMLLETGKGETDASGAFRLPSLEPGVYDLRVAKSGYAWEDVKNVLSGTHDIVISLSPGTRVIGRVLGPDREPVSGAEALLRSPRPDVRKLDNPLAMVMADFDVLGERDQRATSDDAGRFQLDSFKDGVYELLVESADYPEHKQNVTLLGQTVNVGDVVLEDSLPISGRVVSPDGVPVEGARVRAFKSSSEESSIALRAGFIRNARSLGESETDTAGEFRLARLDLGTYDLVATASEFAAGLARAVEVGTMGTTITLQAGVVVRGRVVDAESGEPIPQVRVREAWRSTDQAAVTDEDGQFELVGPDPLAVEESAHRIQLRVRHDHYGTVYEEIKVKDGQVDPVQIRLTQRRGIEGVVKDDQGTPVRKARVSIEVPGFPPGAVSLNPYGAPGEVFTDEDGAFYIVVPRMGWTASFEVVAQYAGFAKARFGPVDKPGEGEDWPLVEIFLSRGTRLKGRITDLGGHPVAGARVAARRDVQITGELLLFAQLLPRLAGEITYSSEDGSYDLGGIESGRYRLEVRAQGYATKNAGPIDVGEEETTLDVALDPGGTLAGRVVDMEGEPFPGIEVVAFLDLQTASDRNATARIEAGLTRLGGMGTASTKTDTDGAYELTRLPQGELRVVARAPGFESAEVRPVRSGEAMPDLVLVPYSKILARVFDGSTGTDVTGYEVTVERKQGDGEYEESWRLRRALKISGARFELDPLGAGDYRIRVLARGYVPRVNPVRLEPGVELEIEFMLDSGPRVEVLVRNGRTGEPIQGAYLSLYRVREGGGAKWMRHGSRRSDEKGRATMAGFAEGEYRIDVHHPMYHLDDRSGAQRIKVPFVDASPFLHFVMYPAGRLEGTLRNLPPVDQRNEGYFVVLTELTEGDGTTRGSNEAGTEESEGGVTRRTTRSHSTWVDKDGEFQADSLPPGRYRVELERRRWRRAEDGGITHREPEKQLLGEVEVAVGETTSFAGRAP